MLYSVFHFSLMFTALEAPYGGCTGLCMAALGARKAQPRPGVERKKETPCFIHCDVFAVTYSSLFGENNPYQTFFSSTGSAAVYFSPFNWFSGSWLKPCVRRLEGITGSDKVQGVKPAKVDHWVSLHFLRSF